MDRDRALRRRHRRERQAVLFGGLVAGLAVAALGGIAVFTGAVGSPFSRGFSTAEPDPESSVAAAPCPPEGTLPVAYGSVQVNVLNGTSRAGLATETSTALTERGFVVLGTGNSPTSVSGTARISFGAAGIGAAYTLAAQLDGPVLVLDAREDATVDLAVGADYLNLLDPAAVVLDPAAPLTGSANCIALSDAVPAPAPVAATEPAA
ncbi:LytR C-terminal domain-containing protein [Pengzhenrongella sicca]|uniref:LytR C-terminal domain-containing protein n=1 Tax=Pengzhenrongella sicca TaxID=2819238 RepID=A0A8A4ZJU8_9MICO|nr:LytR C-terminal domain-containing protein [Pengzhenrongella sicca]